MAGRESAGVRPPAATGSYEELREIAETVAVEAAALVRGVERADVSVAARKSSPVDVVTETDRRAEAFLRDRLGALRPDDGFFGEEGGRRDSATGVTWVIDPIDGTVNFLYGIPHYCVSVAAVNSEQETVAGAVVDVVHGTVYTAARGGGATQDGAPLEVRGPAPLGEQLFMTGFHYRREVREVQGEAVARLLPLVRDIRRAGSAALDLCALAAGTADAYVEEGPQLWDRAAGGLVAAEAGAVVALHPGAGGMECVVAAPAAAYDEVLRVVADCGFLAAT